MADSALGLAPGEAAVASFTGRLRALRERTEAARAVLAGACATASSPDSAVTVSVDASGVLTALRFGDSAFALGPSGLSATVLATVREARMTMLDQAQHRIADIVGESSPAVAVLRRQASELAATEVPPTVDDEDDIGFAGRER